MNKSILAALVLSPCAVAADDTSLSFTKRTFELPPLSLVDGTKVAPLTVMSDAANWFHRQSRASAAPRRLVSQMPIVVPKAGLDPKMVRAPSSSTDYKLLVKAPAMDSAK